MINGYLLRDVINKVGDIHFTSSDEIHTLGHLYESMLKEMRDAAGDSRLVLHASRRCPLHGGSPGPQTWGSDPRPGLRHLRISSRVVQAPGEAVQTVEDRRILQNHSIFGGEAKSLPHLLAQINLVLHGLESPKIDPLNSLRFPLREIGDRDRVDIIMTNPSATKKSAASSATFPKTSRRPKTALLFLQLIVRKLKRPGAPRQSI